MPLVDVVPKDPVRAAKRSPLAALIVEDSPDDAELTLRALAEGGYDVTSDVVDTPEAMTAALERRSWDVIVSDYSMPRFSAHAALAIMQARAIDVPFIILSGTVGDDVAVAAMKAGAHDFIVKGKLARFLPALERELREVKVRAAQKRMREQLLISERMASAGTLAAGVAHEINNPLAVVAANLEYVAAALSKAMSQLAAAEGDGAATPASAGWFATQLDQLQAPVEDAREAAIRIRDIVRDVKLFSGSRDDSHGPVDVRTVIESSSRMAANEIRHRAQLSKRYSDVPAVEANEGRLGQVILNLLINAAQAIPEGSAHQNEISISTRLAPPDQVIVEVRDTGSGIPPSILERIFDPFFTTKPVGVGTGLGLSICHRIVADLGGQLLVESKVGVGTVFRLVLPIATRAAPAKGLPTTAPSVRRGRVLVVDDDVAVCQAVRRVVSPYHDVTVTTSGRDAVARLVGGERFDAIVTDLMMPEVTGVEIYEELKRLVPEQARRMVFLTGGAFTESARGFLEAVPNPQLDKPLEINQLLAIVAGLVK